MRYPPVSGRVPVGNVALLVVVLLAGDVALRCVGAQPGGAAPKVVTAQEFRLVDGEGKTRASMAVQADGSAGMVLLDKGGKRRAVLRLRPDGSPSLSLHDADGRNRATLDMQADDSIGLILTNRDGKGGAAMVVPPNGEAAAVLKDKDGNVVWAEPSPHIEIKDDDKKPDK
jgi:hypothetical protein